MHAIKEFQDFYTLLAILDFHAELSLEERNGRREDAENILDLNIADKKLRLVQMVFLFAP